MISFIGVALVMVILHSNRIVTKTLGKKNTVSRRADVRNLLTSFEEILDSSLSKN